jgi:hypothetical protein
MQKFLIKYTTDPGFKDFIDTINSNNEVLMEFVYNLYMVYGINAQKEASHLINASLLNIDNLIKFFEEKGEFERCQKLVEIKKKI